MSAVVAQRVTEAADLVTVALDELLPRAEGPEARLTEAMRYAALVELDRLLQGRLARFELADDPLQLGQGLLEGKAIDVGGVGHGGLLGKRANLVRAR